MKALVALLCVAMVSSSHVLEKRSILGVGQDHQHHHEHHDEHERTSRDSPVSAPAGYLPPAEDDYADYDDDSAGFGSGKDDSTNSNARGFDQQGQASENQQSQYGQNAISPQSGTVGNSLRRQFANGRKLQVGNQWVKFGQRINQNFQNTGLKTQQGSRRNPEGREGNQQKAQRTNQFDLENDQDGSLGTYGNELDQNLNNQQQDRPGSQIRQENNQRGPGINSQFDILEDSTDQSQYGQNTGGTNVGQSGNNFIGQPGQRHQFGRQGSQNQNKAEVQRNQQQGQGISLQTEDNQFDQGLQGNRQTQSGQFSQGGNGQQQGQGQDNSFGNQQVLSQSADAGYGAPGQGHGNKKSQIGQNQRGQYQRGQNQIEKNQKGQNKRGQNQRGQNQVGFNQGNSPGNQQEQGQSADESYGAPGQGQDNNKSQNGQNQRGQSQRGQNQTGQNKRGQNQSGQNPRAQNKRGQKQPGQSQIGKHQRGQNQVGFSQGNKQVQGQSANKSYGAPGQGQDNNKFQIGQNQRGQPQKGKIQQGQTQKGQHLGGKNDKRQNQRGQNQRAFPSQYDSSIATRPTINRFLPSSQDNQIVSNGYGAPPLSRQIIQGQNSHGGQSGQNSQRSQTGGGRNGNTGESFAAQGVQPGTETNVFPFSSTESNDFEDKFQLEDALICPGGTIESCIKVCPGNTALLYGGCVQGCAERCDAQGQGGPHFGQQGIPGQNVQLGQQGQPIISGQSDQQGHSGQSQGAEDQQGQYGQQSA